MGTYTAPLDVGQELESPMRFDLQFLAYADVGPEWNGTQGPLAGPNRLFHFVVSGKAHLKTGGRRTNLVPGHAYYLPSLLTTTRTCPSRYAAYYGMFTLRDLGGRDLLTSHNHPLDLGEWDRNFMKHQRHSAQLVSRQLYVKNTILLGLLSNYPGLMDDLDNRSAASGRFQGCLSFIKDNLSAELTVSELAEREGLSRNAFTRAFKTATGATPRAYLNNELNQQACRMALTSEMTIREIGNALGFSDEYYFNRFFKKMNGVPPLRYRRSMS